MKKLIQKFLIFLIIFSWVFSGWPQLFNFKIGNTRYSMPPAIHEAKAAITYIASSSQPVDNGSVDGVPTPSITPPSGMQAGDLVILVAQGRGAYSLAISATGGQTWNTENHFRGTNVSARIFWCRYTGSWSANPSVSGVANNVAETLVMFVFRPTKSQNTWAVDVNMASSSFSAPGSPYTVTIPAVTTNTDGAVVFAAWAVGLANTWGSLSGSGWNSVGTNQYRNTMGSDQSISFAYNILASKGSTGTVSKNESAGTAGAYATIAFKEVNSAPIVSITQPDGDSDIIGENKSYVINYSLSDPEEAVTAALYWDTDTSDYNGTAIASCAAVGESSTTCTWKTTDISPGTYYIYASTTDGVNAPVYSAYSGALTINAEPTLSLTEPNCDNDVVEVGQTFEILYNFNDPDDEGVTLSIYYDDRYDDRSICYGIPEGSGTCYWDTTGVVPDDYFLYASTTDGYNTISGATNGCWSITVTAAPNVSPIVSILQPDGVDDSVVVGESYNITYSLSDSDDVVTAALYWDTDTSDYNGTAIAACSAVEEGGDPCAWDTTGMSAGDYYIYASTTDGVNAPVRSAYSGALTIEAAVYSVSITSDGFVEYGYVPLSGSKSTIDLSDTQSVQNTGNISVRLNIKTTNATSSLGNWTLGSATGTKDVFVHEFATSSGWVKFAEANVYQTLAEGVAQSGYQNFDLRIGVPSAVSDYDRKSISIIIQATQ